MTIYLPLLCPSLLTIYSTCVTSHEARLSKGTEYNGVVGAGKPVRGQVVVTISNGRIMWQHGKLTDQVFECLQGQA